MKKTLALLIVFLTTGAAFADSNIFQSNNPFPQTMPESLNNIYESKPDVIQQEDKQEKKSWFRKGKNLRKQEMKESAEQSGYGSPVNENHNNGSFYVFK